MSHWRRGNQESARQWYSRAVERAAQVKGDGTQFTQIKAEAARVIGLDGP